MPCRTAPSNPATPSAGTCLNQAGTLRTTLFVCSFETLSPGDVRTVDVRFRMNTGWLPDVVRRDYLLERKAGNLPASSRPEFVPRPTWTWQSTSVCRATRRKACKARAASWSVRWRFNPSQNVVMTLDVPASVQLTALQGQGWTCSRPTAQQGRCSIASLPNGEALMVYNFIASTPGPIQVHASVTANGDG